ncbi:MAG: hypothetical protein B7X48_03715 [Acidiphilium sp. 34-60-192]|nr:MAG: hypothetical protein B7X48_03715 [Acidiphilium sp. 34-60-192]
MLHTPPAFHRAAASVKPTGQPIYVHMNGANMFLERTVFAAPGQTVIFVNEDTGGHTIIGYNPSTGATSKRFDGVVAGGNRFVAKVRPGVHGFGDPMAGRIIVTTDPTLLAENPKTAHEKILPAYFGG